MTMTIINATAAQEFLKKGALLVDIRDTMEHARERIAGARNIPLSVLCNGSPELQDRVVIFHCKSGTRARLNAEILRKAGNSEVLLLEGGIEGWKQAGFPSITNRRAPIEIMRQVQIVAGGLTLAGAVLGALAHPGFYALSALVGGGLLFAGVSGSCTMAGLLRRMPWNRVAT